MDGLTILKMFPNIFKMYKMWEYNENEVLYFGKNNASATLRFTRLNDVIKKQYLF